MGVLLTHSFMEFAQRFEAKADRVSHKESSIDDCGFVYDIIVVLVVGVDGDIEPSPVVYDVLRLLYAHLIIKKHAIISIFVRQGRD